MTGNRSGHLLWPHIVFLTIHLGKYRGKYLCLSVWTNKHYPTPETWQLTLINWPSFRQPLGTRHFLSNPFRPIQVTENGNLWSIQDCYRKYRHPIIQARMP